MPVWAGCTHNSTRTLVRQASRLKQIRGVERRALRQSLLQQAHPGRPVPALPGAGPGRRPLPVVLYNVPGRTAVNLEPETVVRLAEAAPNIQAIKEASGKLPQIAELVHSLPRGFKSSPATTTWPWPPSASARKGSSASPPMRFPLKPRRMIRAALNNNWAEAREFERRYGRSSRPISGSRIPPPSRRFSPDGPLPDHVRLPLVTPTGATRRGSSGWPANSACSSTCPRPTGPRKSFRDRGEGAENRK